MAKKVCMTKLKRELKAFNASPPAHVPAVFVNESNMLEWHFLLEGPPDSNFHGGFYIGKLIFPADYPFAPPAIMVLTPNGRFKPGAKICMSMSDFHPESWNPSWSVATILVGLLSFMLEDSVATGSIETSEEEKKQLAADSLVWNLRSPKHASMFPQLEAAQCLPVGTASSSAQSATPTESQDASSAMGQPPVQQSGAVADVAHRNANGSAGLLSDLQNLAVHTNP